MPQLKAHIAIKYLVFALKQNLNVVSILQRSAMELANEVGATFNKDRSMYKFPTITYPGSRGAIHNWTIRVRLITEGDYIIITDEIITASNDALAGITAEITVKSKQEGGKIRDIVPTYVDSGKNLGKKNETNCFTQAVRNALGLYNKHKKGVSTHVAAVTNVAADQRPPPMLVKNISDSPLTQSDIEAGITIQPKLNGVRLVVYCENNECPLDVLGTRYLPTHSLRSFEAGTKIICYSRTATDYPGQEQIVEELRPILMNAPPPHEVFKGILSDEILALYKNPQPHLDGELYLHGRPLNWISGQARKSDDEGELEYHIFDVFFPSAKAAGHDMESQHRQMYLAALLHDSSTLVAVGESAASATATAASTSITAHIKRVKNFALTTSADMLAKSFIQEGYEGAIARKNKAGYQYGYNGYHSRNALKIKPKFDAEFPVVGYTQGIKGKDVGAIIWECVLSGTEIKFTVVPNMTYEDRYKLFKIMGNDSGNGQTVFDRYIKGLPLTVEYREISAVTGKPLQAKALLFRSYESGTGNDPVAIVMSMLNG